MIRLQTIRSRTIVAGLAASCLLALPGHAWGNKNVIDPAKGYVWTGDRCTPRWQRPDVRYITEADYEAAIAELLQGWTPGVARQTYAHEVAVGKAATLAEARKRLRAWLDTTIYPPNAQVECPENITNILAWAERRDAETYVRLNPPAKD